MITVIGNLKGGSGKSTIAFNLAIWLAWQECDVKLLDLDPQKTLTDLIGVREEEGYLPAVKLLPSDMPLENLRKQKGMAAGLWSVLRSETLMIRYEQEELDRIFKSQDTQAGT